MSSLINSQIGAYRLTRLIGVGGMGEVYRAEHTRIGRVVAIKVLSRAERSPAALERFFNEARIHAGISHPGIVRLFDFVEHRGVPCIVMELVEGLTLEEHLASRPRMTVAEAMATFRQVVAAVAHLHQRGVVHRDLKSSNIAMAPGGEVKLLDFGIARDLRSPRLTREGMCVATPHYAAPEVLTGAPAAPTGDVWALGVLLYEVLTGAMPFDGASLTEQMAAIRAGRYAPPSQANPGCAGAVEQFLARLLEPRLERRLPNAVAVLNALEVLLAALPGAVAARPRAPAPAVARPAGQGLRWADLTGRLMAFLEGDDALWRGLSVLLLLGALALAARGLMLEPVKPVPTAPAAPVAAPAAGPPGMAPLAAPLAEMALVRVGSIPVAADVVQEGRVIGRTPLSFPVPVGMELVLVLRAEGYADKPLRFTVRKLESENVFDELLVEKTR